jgi:hypothetical protein
MGISPAPRLWLSLWLFNLSVTSPLLDIDSSYHYDYQVENGEEGDYDYDSDFAFVKLAA